MEPLGKHDRICTSTAPEGVFCLLFIVLEDVPALDWSTLALVPALAIQVKNLQYQTISFFSLPGKVFKRDLKSVLGEESRIDARTT